MKIPLDLISPSPHPVRTQWDEDKMEELTQSIKEQGLIVPIKVRSNGDDGYEVVYGHRRVEACRRAGVGEVEAIIEGVDDTQQLVQALIENLQREDPEPLDTAKALKKLMNYTNWTLSEIGALGILSYATARRLLKILDLSPEVQNLISSDKSERRVPDNKIPYRHIDETTILPQDEQEELLKKAAKEGLSQRQVRQAAEAIKEAPSPQAKKRLLEMQYSPVIHDPDNIKQRAKKYGAHDPFYHDSKPSPQDAFDSSPEIKMLLEGIAMAISTFIQLIAQIKSVVSVGKIAPEGKQFIAHKLRSFRDKIDNLIDELESE